MFHIEEVLQVKDTEDVKLVVRRHPVALVPGLGIALVLIVAPFFFLFPLFSWGVPGVVSFGASIVAGIVVAVRAIILWNADVLIITTLRVVQVDQRGMFSRFVTEVPLASVQDVSWRNEGVVDTVTKAGTLSIQSVGTSPNVEVRRIAHPERLHELLNDLRHRTAPKRSDLPPDVHERLKRIMADVEQLPEDALTRVEAFVRSQDREQAVATFLDERVPEGVGVQEHMQESASEQEEEQEMDGTLAVEVRPVPDSVTVETETSPNGTDSSPVPPVTTP
ncbi:PH domain-containing protein [Patescibacteria group bacterium]|nr:PH domain-containing protein [Patescibacteria group bacterium]MBU1448832.1 PH domain-containing protein [Patescibacteria group bacterium]MBU2613228.1 PH domain-containing protein [Patescibacteria group bacterium]